MNKNIKKLLSLGFEEVAENDFLKSFDYWYIYVKIYYDKITIETFNYYDNKRTFYVYKNFAPVMRKINYILKKYSYENTNKKIN